MALQGRWPSKPVLLYTEQRYAPTSTVHVKPPNTAHDQNKAHALINVHPPFQGRFQAFSILDQIEINISEVDMLHFCFFMLLIVQNRLTPSNIVL